NTIQPLRRKMASALGPGPGFPESPQDRKERQMSRVNQRGSAVIPGLRYRNAPAAIDWLCKVFGFEKQLVVPSRDGPIATAELTLAEGMIMHGSVSDTELGRLMKQPDEIGGAETQSVYLLVEDADAVYARAKSAGATIVVDIVTRDFGG